MPPMLVFFCCLQLNRSSCEITFAKSIVHSDIMLTKLGQSYYVFFPDKNSESREIAVRSSQWQVFKTFETLEVMNKSGKLMLLAKFFLIIKKYANPSLT